MVAVMLAMTPGWTDTVIWIGDGGVSGKKSRMAPNTKGDDGANPKGAESSDEDLGNQQHRSERQQRHDRPS